MNKKGWDTQNLLIGNYFTSCDEKLDVALVSQVLASLIVDNLRIFVVHRSFSGNEGNAKEQWYGTEYQRSTALQESTWMKWRDNPTCMRHVLALPQPNPFVPFDFDLKCDAMVQVSVTYTITVERLEETTANIFNQIITTTTTIKNYYQL